MSSDKRNISVNDYEMNIDLYSILRDIWKYAILILLPAAYLLAQSGNVNLVWWAFPIAELVSVGATAFFLMKINRSIVSRIGQ